MNTDKKQRIGFICVYLCSSVVPLFFLPGCSSPNAANIELRKQNQQLGEQIDALKREHNADRATIAGLEAGATTVPSLPQDRLDQLFTTHGLRFGRLTGGANLDPKKRGDDAIRVAVVPIDEQGQSLKAAGSFEIEAFDLQASGDTHVGRWTFDVQQARNAWLGEAFQYEYLLTCPFQVVPKHSELTIRVTFTDALTERKFTEQRQIKIKLP